MYCISQTPVHLRLRTASGIQVTFHYVLGSHREVTAAQGFSHSEHSGWIKGLGSYIHKEPNHTASCNWLVADSVFMSLSPTSPSSMYGKQNKTQDIQLMLNIENTKTIISQLSPEIDEYLAGPVLIACRHHLTNISSEFFFFFRAEHFLIWWRSAVRQNLTQQGKEKAFPTLQVTPGQVQSQHSHRHTPEL